MSDELWETYCQIWEKCKKAKEDGKKYINIQYAKDGGYRLMASNSQGRESCSCFDGFSPADWASNVIYRLADLAFVDRRSLDAIFDQLERTGYESKPLSRRQRT